MYKIHLYHEFQTQVSISQASQASQPYNLSPYLLVPLQFLPAAACPNSVIDNSRDKFEYVLMPITDMMTRNSVAFNVRGCDSVKILLTNLSDPDDYNSLVKVCHVMRACVRACVRVCVCVRACMRA